MAGPFLCANAGAVARSLLLARLPAALGRLRPKLPLSSTRGSGGSELEVPQLRKWGAGFHPPACAGRRVPDSMHGSMLRPERVRGFLEGKGGLLSAGPSSGPMDARWDLISSNTTVPQPPGSRIARSR